MCRENLIDFSSYKIYEDGTIFSKHRQRPLKGAETPDGYLRISLKTVDGMSDSFMWNRVIYYYFNGDIPDEMKVNHIDEDKKNNSIFNLNLLTHEENCNWGTRNVRISKAHKGRKSGSPSEETRKKMSDAQKRRMAKEKEKYYKPIWQYENGELVGVYKSVKEASEITGFDKSNISSASRGVLNRQGNHKLGKYMFYNAAQI